MRKKIQNFFACSIGLITFVLVGMSPFAIAAEHGIPFTAPLALIAEGIGWSTGITLGLLIAYWSWFRPSALHPRIPPTGGGWRIIAPAVSFEWLAPNGDTLS